MADTNYNIQLLDGKKLTLSSDVIEQYPTIKEQITDMAGDILFLTYDDPEALYIVLTTKCYKTTYTVETLIRYIKAEDYLGNDNILNNRLQLILAFFDESDIIALIKHNKKRIKELMGSLPDTILWRILELYTGELNCEYTFSQGKEDVMSIVSDDLNYTVSITERESMFQIDSTDIFHKGQHVQSFKQPKNIDYVISDIGDIYYLQQTGVKSSAIMRYTYCDINRYKYTHHTMLSTPEKGRKIGKYWNTIRLCSDGSKYMTSVVQKDDSTLYEIRNIADDGLIMQGQGIASSFRNPFEYYQPSPRMQVVIKRDANISKYFIHRAYDDKIIEIQRAIMPIPNDHPIKIVDKLSSCYFKTCFTYLIFSYDEYIYMEITCMSTEIPISQKLSTPQIKTVLPKHHYHVRILNTDGDIVIKPFITDEKPVSISNKFLLTAVSSMEKMQRNNTDVNFLRPHILIRSLANLKGNIIYSNDAPKTPMRESNGIFKVDIVDIVAIKTIVPGTNDTFLFIYETYEVNHINGDIYKHQLTLTITKYNVFIPNNMNEYIDYKLT